MMIFYPACREASFNSLSLNSYPVKSLSILHNKIAAVAFAALSVMVSSLLIYHYYAQRINSFLFNVLDRVREFFPQPSQPVSHLILNIDINRTVMADDPNAGFSLTDILAMLLSENYTAKWKGQEMSFQEYVFTLIPGSHNGFIKKQRQAILKDFVHLLMNLQFQSDSTIHFAKLKEHPQDDVEQIKQKINQVKSQIVADLKKFKAIDVKKFEALKKQVIADYKQMEEKLLPQPQLIFPSLFRFIKWLKNRKNVNFHIVFRTFGDDAKKVVAEIEKAFPDEKFTHTGQYLNGEWHITTVNGLKKEGLKTVKKVYQFFKSQECKHIAIKDHWQEWNANKESQDHAKRFLIKLNSKHTHSIFIDDNIERESASKKNIVTPLDVEKNQQIAINPLIEKKLAIRTDTMQAILNDRYFIDILEESLKLNGKRLA